MKFFLLLAVIVAVYWFFKSYKRKSRGGAKRPGARGPEDMVRCAQCGVHLPRSESLTSGQVFYCSPEHRRLREPAD